MTIDERIEFLMRSAESHDRQIGELTDTVAKIGDNVEKLADKVEKLADSVDRLTVKVDGLASLMADLLGAVKIVAEGVENHERRISGLEARQ